MIQRDRLDVAIVILLNVIQLNKYDREIWIGNSGNISKPLKMTYKYIDI